MMRRNTSRKRGQSCSIESLENRQMLDGDFANVLTRGSVGADRAGTVVVSQLSDAYYVGGSFSGLVDFDPGAATVALNSDNGNGYIAKYNTNNTLVWVKQVPGQVTDLALNADATSVYASGVFEGTKDFDPGAGVANRMSNGFLDPFVLKLSTGGSFNWARTFGSSSYTDYAHALAVDLAGNVYTTGYFSGQADFDPGAGVSNRNAGTGSDAYVQVLSGSGTYLNAVTFSGDASEGTDIALDNVGSIYVTGSFRGTVDFDPWSPTNNHYSTSDGVSPSTDAFVVKLLSSSPQFILGSWARRLGGTLFDEGFGIAVDAVGNVYTAGRYTHSGDFNPSPGAVNTLNSAGGSDAFVSKLDSAGNFVWARSMGSAAHHEYATGIALDGDRNVYTTGRFNGTGDFNPNAGTATLTNSGVSDVFVSKLDTNGTHLFARKIGGAGADEAYDVAVGRGRVYVAGSYSGAVDFDPNAGTQNRSSAGGSADAFVSQLSTVPTDLQYALKLGYIEQNVVASVSDAVGNTYVTGTYHSVMDFDPSASASNPANAGGYDDIFVAKYAADGRFLWVRSLYQREVSELAGDVAVAPNGDVIVVGSFNGTLDFNPGAGETNRTAFSKNNAAVASRAAFVWRLDKSGNLKWVRTPGDYYGNIEAAKAVAVDAAGNVVVAGTSTGTLHPSDGFSTDFIEGKGGTDVWVARFAAADGATAWGGTMGGTGNDDVTDVAVGSDGKVHVVGSFASPTFDANPALYGAATLSRAGAVSAFVVELQSYGAFVQAKKFGGGGSDSAIATGVALDSAGAIHIVGRFTGTLDLNPSGSATSNVTSAGLNDLFLVKLNTDGNYIWGHRRGGTGEDGATGLALGPGGSIFVSGYFSNSCDWDPGVPTVTMTSAGGRDAFLWKVNSSGVYQSARRLGGSSGDSAVAVSVDSLGRISLVGIYNGTVDLDPGTFTFNFTNSGYGDIFILKLLR